MDNKTLTLDISEEENDEGSNVPTPEPPKKKRGNPNLAEARLKAQETRKKKAAIKQAAKLAEKQKLDEDYEKAQAILEPKAEPIDDEPVEVPKKPKVPKVPKKRTKIIELTDSSSESESESDDESVSSQSTIEEVRVVRKPRAKTTKAKTTKTTRKSKGTDELSGAVARDMLRSKLLRNAENEAIKMLFPHWTG